MNPTTVGTPALPWRVCGLLMRETLYFRVKRECPMLDALEHGCREEMATMSDLYVCSAVRTVRSR
jgi:hypothetical protein